jgi:RNA polymerase sigma factor (TIGR02999 family)
MIIRPFRNWLNLGRQKQPIMSASAPGEVTNLLLQWQQPEARTRLFAIIYPEMKRIAELRMRRERPDHTLQPTALVHEVFLHLVSNKSVTWRNRAHFLAIASEAMRRILVDCARARHSQKRAGALTRVSLDPDDLGRSHGFEEVLQIDNLLSQLAAHDARAAEVVELRYFGGLTFEEIGSVLGVNERTAKRDWQVARAWLLHAMTQGNADDRQPVESDQEPL